MLHSTRMRSVTCAWVKANPGNPANQILVAMTTHPCAKLKVPCGLPTSTICKKLLMDDSSVSTPRTPRRYCRLNAHTPISARKTPGDRFIPSRAGADLQFSAYKVRSGRRSRAENCPAQDNTRTPLADSAKRKEVRERLFALRGRSSDSKVLNFKQTPATCALKQRNGKFLLHDTFFHRYYAFSLWAC